MSSQNVQQSFIIDNNINQDVSILSITQQTLQSQNICSNIQSVTSIINQEMQSQLENQIPNIDLQQPNLFLIANGLPSQFYLILLDKDLFFKQPRIMIMHFLDRIMKTTKNYLEQKIMIDVEQTQMFMNSFMSGFMAGQANTTNKSLRKGSNNKKALLDLNLFFRQNMMKMLVNETLKSILSIQDLMYTVGQETGRLTDIMGKSESIMGQVNLQYKPFIKKIEKLIKDDAKRKQIWLELKKDSFIEFLNSNLLLKKTQIQSLSRQISLSQNKYKKIVKQLRNSFQKKPSEPQKQRLKRVYSVDKDQIIQLKKKNFKKTSNSKQKHSLNLGSLPKIKTNYQTKFCQSLKPKKTEPKLKLYKSKPKEVKGKQQIKTKQQIDGKQSEVQMRKKQRQAKVQHKI